MAGSANPCIFCQIARSSTSTPLLHSDDRVVGFPDTNPSAFRHYLVISIEHIPTVKDLRRRTEDYQLVSHMLDVGRNLLRKDAPESKLYKNVLPNGSMTSALLLPAIFLKGTHLDLNSLADHSILLSKYAS